MKRSFPFLLSALIVMMPVIGCTDRIEEEAVATRQLIIEASIPSDAVKAGFNGDKATHVYWKAGDALRVFNHNNPANNSRFDIQDGFTDHWARFAGDIPTGVSGAKYDIVTPAAYASALEAEAGDYELIQTGNNNPDHLVFTAKLSNVAEEDLGNITFSSAWVDAHPGTSLNKGAIIKIVATLPEDVTDPRRVAVSGIGYREVSVKVTGVDSSTDKNLVVFLQYGWDDLSIPANSDLDLYVQDADGRNWKTTRQTSATAKTFKAGSVNILNFPGGSWTEELFAGGDGSEGNPYLIATPVQLNNMRSAFVHMQKIHFRLIKDIDMTAWNVSNSWTPLNGTSPYDYAVDLDGAGHTINNFKVVANANACAMFHVLYGEVHDLKFTNAYIEQSSSTGKAAVIASFCGYKGMPAHVYNVDVQGTVKNNAGHFTGGIAGISDGALIESCSADVHVWAINTKNCVGGILGCDDSGTSGDSWVEAKPTIIRNCWTSGTVRGAQRVGGIVGGLGGQSATCYTHGSQVINCYSIARVDFNDYNGDVSVASGGSRSVGGIVGHALLGQQGADKSIDENLKPDNHIEGCIAWQTIVNEDGTGLNRYSAGAIVGYTSVFNYLSNCWRNPDMVYDFGGKTLVDQNDASPANQLQGVESPYYYPYHGKAAASGRLSTVAQSIGWSDEVWDFSGDTPQFKEPRQVETVTAKESDKSTLASYASASDRAAGAQYPVIGETNWKGKNINASNWKIEQIRPGITYYHYENTADTDFASDAEKAFYWNEETSKWVYYHHGSYNTFTAGATHQNVFVLDIDLNRKDYEVKIVRTKDELCTSEAYEAYSAYAAINAGYERVNIAERDNAYYYPGTGQKDLYPNGYRAATLENDEIVSGITNWKSHGTFYCDGVRGIEIGFDAWDPAKGPGSSQNPPVKSTQDMRLYYNYYTGSKAGFISSSPVLIADYWRTGGLFQNTWYRPASNNSTSYLYNSTYDAEHPWRHQRSLYARTAVALNSDNHLLLFVCDGKYPDNVGGVGMSCGWVQNFLYNYFNPQWALNLDGGGSSTMCVDASDASEQKVVNYPDDNYTGKRGNKYLSGNGTNTGNYDHDGERPRNCFIIVAPRENFGTMPTP